MRTVHSHFDLPLNTEGGLLVFKLTGKGGVFLPAVQVEVSGESEGMVEGMVIVIADRAVGGRPHPSTLLRCGSPAPCGSRKAPNMLACFRRRRRASGNTARNAVGI